ncbi:MAG: DUF3667 domain-containing protein [Ferruginibacter sp.]|nr:DUF3667 domain-containing protein [Ferruginibacter sp.]
MSHLKQRKENNCLNCNAIVNGRFCSICGQQNLEPQESVWHLASHFFKDITHFDGKFFSSLKYIITKPGFLSKEYMNGRRATYLNPVQFYVFTSFLFFLVMTSFFLKLDNNSNYNNKNEYWNNDSTEKVKAIINDELKDSIKIVTSKTGFSFRNDKFKDLKQFDSLDKLGKINKGFIGKKISRKVTQLNEKYKGNSQKFDDDFYESITNKLPHILILSLPFFALILKLLYVRNKKFYYVSNIIFAIHFYIFVYIQILFLNILGKLAEFKYFHWLYDVNILIGLGVFYYLYRALRTFYEQAKIKTIAKLVFITFLFFILALFFSTLLLIFSIYKM